MHYVQVRVLPGGMYIDPPQLTLTDDDRDVTWMFSGIPNDVVPFIQFTPFPRRVGGVPAAPAGEAAGRPAGIGDAAARPSAAGGEPGAAGAGPGTAADPIPSVGPFNQITVQPTQIIAVGIAGPRDRNYSYMLSLQPASTTRPIVGFGEIINLAGPSTSPNFFVTYDPATGDVAITPEVVSVGPGQIVFWHLSGEGLRDTIPMPIFLAGPLGPGPSALGPFSSISIARIAPRQLGEVRYWMVGYGIRSFTGRYHFDINVYPQQGPVQSLRQELQKVGRSDDPSIDPAVPPPP